MENILETIAAENRRRVVQEKKKIPPEEMRAMAQSLPRDTGFPFEQALKKKDISFICECKKASPSKGLITPDFPYIEIAKDYEKAGADAISVLTEPKWFQGSNEILSEITKVVKIPCLRKDFTIDPYMIDEAKVLGASAVLLICAILSQTELSEMRQQAEELGMSALIEAHDAREIKMALHAGAKIIGVNNRDLRDFTVDVHNSIERRKLVPKEVLFVSESGVKTAADIDVLREAKADAVLIGETLMRAPDKKKALAALRGGVR